MPQVVVTMRLPFRLQIAEGTTFPVQQSDGSVVHCTVTDYQVSKTEDDMRGTGVDDGLGTFLQSTMSVRFPNQSIEGWGKDKHQQYREKSIAAINQLVEAYRYVTRHASSRPIEKPLDWTLLVTDDTGNPLPDVIIASGVEMAALIAPAATWDPKTVMHIQEVVSGIIPIEYERLLLLDAQYFAMLGDVRHAIFNADTALQVFIDRAVANTPYSQRGYYSKWDEGLEAACGVSPYSLQRRNMTIMEIVEYIHILRNAVAHSGQPIFDIGHLGGWQKKSRYVDAHEKRDGMMVGPESARVLAALATDIIYEFRSYFKYFPEK